MTEPNLESQVVDESQTLIRLQELDSEIQELQTERGLIEGEIVTRLDEVRSLYLQFSDSLAIGQASTSIIHANPIEKRDRRRENNPIKNFNIGVNLSFRHSKGLGYSAEDARERAYESITKKIKASGGRNETGALVTGQHDLPQAVVTKINQCFDTYDVIDIPKTRKKPLVMGSAEGEINDIKQFGEVVRVPIEDLLES